MRKRAISIVLSLSLLASLCAVMPMSASADTVVYKQTARMMEELNRGLIAVATKDGVYLSWRVFGKEDLATTAYDIYREGVPTPIATIAGGQATNYIDEGATVKDKYKVVVSGASAAAIEEEPWVTPQATKGDTTYTYFDVPISKPTDIAHANTTALSDYTRTNKVGGPNDASLGDLDGDGDYEIVLKWDPKNSKDSASGNTTGHCVFDAYEIDPNNGGFMWRIDIGNNIAAGAHYSQFMVYDFDSDGKAEIATITARGSYSLVKNAKGGYDKIYVTTVGDTEEIQKADNNATELRKGNNKGPEYYTIFDGETGRPLRTTAAIPLGDETGSAWGDSKMNRSSRYLACVAYLDGVNPYYVPIRGMYNRTVLRAYSWDGENLTLVKEHNGNKKGETMYGEGNHNLSVADIDNDGKDEIVYGSACLDDDFKTVLGNTKMGHGDAMHVSDFNNDGTIEVFSVKEDKEGWSRGADFRVAKTGTAIWSKKVSTDNGRGVMDNIDDAYAKEHPEALALGWDAANPDAYDFKGNSVAVKPSGSSRSFCNFLVYWDDDLGRELLDDNQMAKYYVDTGKTDRLFFNGQGYLPGTSNNSTKQTPSLVADLWGDWREEIIMPAENDTVLRIITPIKETKYRLTTLMHDSQYRTAIAWQNVGYNQPPHTSYYIGSAALAKDSSGNELNYLAPKTPFDKIMYPSDIPDNPVTDITLTHDGEALTGETITLERGKSYQIDAAVLPSDTRNKKLRWTSSDPTIATVNQGIITAVGAGGDVTITVTSASNGAISKEIPVTVWSTPVESMEITDPSETVLTLTPGEEKTITAQVLPDNASVKKVTWRSSNPVAASVDANGKVSALSMGLATVYAKTEDGGIEDAVVINVLPEATEDVTGDGVFETTNTLDETVKFTGSMDSALLTLAEATVPIEFHKDFEPFNENTVTLSFRFTTGGAKTDGDYIWKKGHEYDTELKLLDTEGNNILNIVEEHRSAGNKTKYIVGNGEKQNASNWTKISEGSDTAWDRSQIRWDINVTLNYTADTGTINLAGCSKEWLRGEVWETTFPLNGASFKTLKYETNNITDWVSGSPILENFSYEKIVPATDGASNVLYRRGEKNGISWSQSDVSAATGFTPTDQTNYPLTYDAENKRILFNTTKPAASYSATKTFAVDDEAIVEYDLDWYFGNAIGTDRDHSEYVQIGDKIRFGWKNDYKVYFSQDGGATWARSVFTGSNAVFNKNIHLLYDKKTNTVKSLTFDGSPVLTNTELEDSMDKVTFGLNRVDSSTNNWAYPCGLDNISVSQFVPGAEAKFRVTYMNVDGSVIDEQDVEVGGKAETISNPAKEADDKYGNYEFVEWNPDPETTLVIDNVVFEAKYNMTDPRSYTVTLNTGGGTISDEGNVAGYTYGTSVLLPTEEQITKHGHTFLGWYEDEEFTSDMISEIGEDETGNKTYYAKWEANVYPIEFNLGGGTITGTENITGYTYGTAVTLPTPKKTGCTFEGWYDNEDFEGDAVTSIPAGEEGEKVYWAKFAAASYSVTMHIFGGTVATPITEYSYGTAIELPTPVKDGYTFDGWYSNATYRTKASKILATDTGNKNFYAKWKAASPSIEIGDISDDGSTAAVYFAVPDKTNVIIGALYDGTTLVEVKSAVASTASNFEANVVYSKDLSFDHNVHAYTLKVFVWNSVDGMKPIAATPANKVKAE